MRGTLRNPESPWIFGCGLMVETSCAWLGPWSDVVAAAASSHSVLARGRLGMTAVMNPSAAEYSETGEVHDFKHL